SGEIPSIVVILLPTAMAAGTLHDRTGWPSICTVHAPHCPMPQLNFVPVRPTSSRITHSNGVCEAALIVCRLPFTVRSKGMGLESIPSSRQEGRCFVCKSSHECAALVSPPALCGFSRSSSVSDTVTTAFGRLAQPRFQMVFERPPAAFGGSPPHGGENKALTLQALISPS